MNTHNVLIAVSCIYITVE